MEYIEIVTPEERGEYKFGESVIIYRRADRDKMLEIEANNTHPKRDNKDNIIRNKITDDIIQEVDYKKNYDDLIEWVVVDWTGVKANGKDVKCERKFKLALPPSIRDAVISKSKETMITGETEKKTDSSS